MTINLQTIATEHRNENTMNLDQMSSLEIITEMNRDDALISSAIQPHLPNISKVIEYCIGAIQQGGRIIYMEYVHLLLNQLRYPFHLSRFELNLVCQALRNLQILHEL